MERSGWDAAAELAAAGPAGAGSRRPPLRSRRTTVLAVIVIAVLLAALVGVFALGPLLPRLTLPDWLLPIRLVLLGAGLVLLFVGPFRAWNRGEDAPSTNRILAPLSRAERHSVWRQWAGAEPVDDEHRDVLVAEALEERRGSSARRYSTVAYSLFIAGVALGSPSVAYLILVGAALAVVVVGYALRLHRDALALRFLRRIRVGA